VRHRLYNRWDVCVKGHMIRPKKETAWEGGRRMAGKHARADETPRGNATTTTGNSHLIARSRSAPVSRAKRPCTSGSALPWPLLRPVYRLAACPPSSCSRSVLRFQPIGNKPSGLTPEHLENLSSTCKHRAPDGSTATTHNDAHTGVARALVHTVSSLLPCSNAFLGVIHRCPSSPPRTIAVDLCFCVVVPMRPRKLPARLA